MNVMQTIRERRSVRKYKPKQVDKEKLQLVLEAGRLAPSANNRQEWRYVVVTDGQIRDQLCRAAANQTFVAQAPVVIACCAETNNHIMQCGQPCYPIDVAISIDHITLKAWEEGLGTCWIGAFSEGEVKKILNIPEPIRVVELLTLGYPDDGPKKKNRLSLDEIVRYEKWA
jgi:nitroreductase